MGMATVRFSTEAQARRAMKEMDNRTLYGARVQIKWDPFGLLGHSTFERLLHDERKAAQAKARAAQSAAAAAAAPPSGWGEPPRSTADKRSVASSSGGGGKEASAEQEAPVSEMYSPSQAGLDDDDDAPPAPAAPPAAHPPTERASGFSSAPPVHVPLPPPPGYGPPAPHVSKFSAAIPVPPPRVPNGTQAAAVPSQPPAVQPVAPYPPRQPMLLGEAIPTLQVQRFAQTHTELERLFTAFQPSRIWQGGAEGEWYVEFPSLQHRDRAFTLLNSIVHAGRRLQLSVHDQNYRSVHTTAQGDKSEPNAPTNAQEAHGLSQLLNELKRMVVKVRLLQC